MHAKWSPGHSSCWRRDVTYGPTCHTQCANADALHFTVGGVQAWPLVARCDNLIRLRLKCLPAFMERLPDACHSLRELQLTYAYAELPVAGDRYSRWVRPSSCTLFNY